MGLRKLNSSYSGPAIRLRRSTDSVESDFGFSGNDLDVSAIAAFLNGATGYCTTLYDQSGTGNHIIQASLAAQPQYIASGLNGRPVLRYSTTQWMKRNTNFPAPFTIVYGARQTGPIRARVLSSFNNNWLLGWWNGFKAQAFYEGWLTSGISVADNAAYVYSGTSNGSTSQIYENGTLIAANSGGVGVTGPDGIRINGLGVNTTNESSDCEFLDLMVYNSVLTATARQAAENSILQYYISTTGNTLTVTPGTSNTYTALGINSNGCTSSDEVIVTVNTAPTVNAGGAMAAICQGATSAALGGSYGGSATGAVWTDGGAGGTFANNTGSTPATATYTANTSTPTVTLTLTTTGTNCNVSASKAITVIAPPVAFATFNSPVCEGRSINLNATTISGATYNWSGPLAFTSTLQNPVINNAVAAMSGTYTLSVTNTNGCIDINNVYLTVNNSPIINLSGDTTICAGSSATLTATGSTSYTWNYDPVTAGATLAVGMRKLYSSYTGSALRIRRSTDNVQADFGFTGNDLNTSAIATFLNGAQGYVTKLYDQSGHVINHDVVQATAANQPLYVASGINGRPVLRFTTSQYMTCNNYFQLPFTVVYAARQTGPTRARVLSSVNNNWLLGWWGGAKAQAYFGGWVSVDAPAADNNAYVYTGSSDGYTSQIYENGSLVSNNLNTQSWLEGPDGLRLNGKGTGAGSELSNAEFFDVVVYHSVLSTPGRRAIENSMMQYYMYSTSLNQMVVSPTATTTYTVTTAANASGCSNTASATVMVNPLPTATISGTTTVCPHSTTGITFTGANGTAPYMFTYRINGGANQTVSTTSGSSVTVSVPPAITESTYSLVSVQDASSTACSRPQTGTAIIPPSTSISYSGSPYCNNGGTPTVTLTGVGGGIFDCPGLFVDPDLGDIYLDGSEGGDYTITYTVPASDFTGCPEYTTTAQVTISPLPSASISYTNSPYCATGGTAFVTLIGTAGGTYSSSAGLSIDANTGDITPGTSTAATYTVTYTVAASGGCTQYTTTAQVIITSMPSATIRYINSPYCSNGGTATVTRTGTAGGTYSSSAGLSIDANTGAITPGTSTEGTYTVTYTVAASGGCTQYTTTAQVSIASMPSATISYANSPYCSNGGTATVTHTGTTGGAYSSSAGLSIDANTGVITPGTSTAGTYTVTYTVTASGGCTQYTTAQVIITPMPSATISYINSPYCSNGGTATVTRTGTTGGTYSSSPGLSIDANTGAITLGTSTAGTYTVIYTVAAGGGCAQFSTNTAISIVNAVSLSISYAGNPFCQTDNYMVTRIGVAGGTYSSDINMSVNAITGRIFPAASTPGVHTITYSVNFPAGCTSSATTTVTILPTPTITPGTAPTICFSATPSTALLPYTTTGSPVTYSIITNATNPMPNYVPVVNASLLASPIPVIVPAGTPGGIYYFDLHVTSASGCISAGRYVFKVTVASQATTIISYAGTPFCATGVGLVTRQGAAGGTYTSSPAGLSMEATSGTIYPAPSTPGNYTLSYTVTLGGCTYTATTNVTIVPIPKITVGTIAPVCVSANAQTASVYSKVIGLPKNIQLACK